ncbi:hypothetical protein KFK09_004034 [Dendrobium nobile]|uniref:Uncharacterized protein n=1 Tax=Dendrobium nobile TaxID=94219 RepID=A0A8T3BZB7_DENNO|nr:hypothetical protein KFK09_004034 [Dendrobium nobile]
MRCRNFLVGGFGQISLEIYGAIFFYYFFENLGETVKVILIFLVCDFLLFERTSVLLKNLGVNAAATTGYATIFMNLIGSSNGDSSGKFSGEARVIEAIILMLVGLYMEVVWIIIEVLELVLGRSISHLDLRWLLFWSLKNQSYLLET